MKVKRSFSFSEDLLHYLKNKIENESLHKEYRSEDQFFTRNRTLGFSTLIYFLLQLDKSSLQQELDCFFASKGKSCTKGALSQHRLKLKPEVFSYLNSLQTSYYYDQATQIKRWRGFRLVAIDGSTIQLPYSEDLVRNFGHFETRTENGRKVVMARISQAYRKCKSIIQGFFNPKKWFSILFEYAFQLVNQLEILRKDRSYPRNKRYSGKPAGFSAYKP